MKMFRVCHLTTVHKPFDIRIFQKECKTLLKAGYGVTLIAQYGRDEIVDGIKIRALQPSSSRLQRMATSNFRIIKAAMKENADMYHFHDPELIVAGLFLKLFGKKVIYDVHEDYPATFNPEERDYIPRRYLKLLSRLTMLAETIGTYFFDGIVTATPAIAKKFPPDKTVVVQNFPVSNELCADITVEYGSRRNVAFYLGGLSLLRGAKEMVQALSLLSPELGVTLLIAGQFIPDSIQEDLRQLPGWEKVNYVGMKSREDVAELLGQARVGLVLFHAAPNNTMSQPNKLFEYMSAGLPVVASNFPLWQDLVGATKSGILVDPLDPQKIADALAWIMTNPIESEAMGVRGKDAVLSKMNWESQSEILIDMYQKLLL